MRSDAVGDDGVSTLSTDSVSSAGTECSCGSGFNNGCVTSALQIGH